MKPNEISPEIQNHLELGNQYAQQGNVGMAIHHYEEALKLNWLNAPVWFNLSLILTVVGDFFHATNAILRAVRLAPKNALYWLKKGQLHHLQWDQVNALMSYEQSIRLNPKDPRPYAQTSTLLLRHQNKAKALAFCEEGLELCSPNHPDYNDLLFIQARLLQDPEWIEKEDTLRRERELDFLIQFYLQENQNRSRQYLTELIHLNRDYPTIPVYKNFLNAPDEQSLIAYFLDQAELAEEKKEWNTCALLYESAYEIAILSEDLETQQLCLELLFHTFQMLEKSSIAFHIGQLILTYLEKEDTEAFAQVLNQIGMLSDHLLCFSQAQELFRMTHLLYEKSENTIGQEDSQFNLGYSYYYEQRFSRASEIFRTFLDHPRLGKKAAERLFFIQEKISPEELEGDQRVEEGQFESALEIYQTLENPRIYQKMAKIYAQLKNTEQEKKQLQKIEQLSQEVYWVFDRLAELEHQILIFPRMPSQLFPENS